MSARARACGGWSSAHSRVRPCARLGLALRQGRVPLSNCWWGQVLRHPESTPGAMEGPHTSGARRTEASVLASAGDVAREQAVDRSHRAASRILVRRRV